MGEVVDGGVIKRKINKPEAARRQIDAAIRMLFNGEDPIAIYKLTMSGLQVLRDLAAKQNENIVDHAINATWDSKEKKVVLQKMREYDNFLKHADKDPTELLDEIELEKAIDLILIIACLYYDSLGHEFTPEMFALAGWLVGLKGAPKSLLKNAGRPIRVAVDMVDELRQGRTFSRKEELNLGLAFLDFSHLQD